MSNSIKKRGTLFGAALGIGATLALVIGLGVLAGAGRRQLGGAGEHLSADDLRDAAGGADAERGRGTWSNSPTDYNYYWMRCDKTGGLLEHQRQHTTYTLTSADVGHTIRFRVEAKNADGTTTSESSVPTAVITAATKPPPQNTSPPTITGTPQEGQTLSGDRGNWSGNPTDYNDFWVRCDKNGGSCSNISGANDRRAYLLKAVDVGNTIRFKVEAKNAGGSTFASSVPTAVVIAAPSLRRRRRRTRPAARAAPARQGRRYRRRRRGC